MKPGDAERERPGTVIHAGRQRARWLVKRRILPQAAAAEAGEAWRVSRIARALDSGGAGPRPAAAGAGAAGGPGRPGERRDTGGDREGGGAGAPAAVVAGDAPGSR